MKIPRRQSLLLFALPVFLPGCLATQSGSLEVLNPKQAYGRSVAVIDDLHRENEAIEKRLASDLQSALSKRGLPMAEDPAKAEIVIVPTLGRMRERVPSPVAVADEGSADGAEPAEAGQPVVAAAPPEARPFNRFSSANMITRGDLISRRVVPSARVPAAAQQAGLLLSAYRGEDFREYGSGRSSLPPVWRVYVSQPAVQMKWNTVAAPLINAAASAAAPLGKSDKAPNADRQAEKTEAGSRPPGGGSRAEKKKDAGPAGPENPGKRKFFGLFGVPAERAE